MIATTSRNGQSQPSPFTKLEIAESHLRVWVREVLKEGGLRAVLKVVKQEFGHKLEIMYKV